MILSVPYILLPCFCRLLTILLQVASRISPIMLVTSRDSFGMCVNNCVLTRKQSLKVYRDYHISYYPSTIASRGPSHVNGPLLNNAYTPSTTAVRQDFLIRETRRAQPRYDTDLNCSVPCATGWPRPIDKVLPRGTWTPRRVQSIIALCTVMRTDVHI